MAKMKKLMLNSNSYTETMDDEIDTVETQADMFSTDYTADKLNELYNEFDSITLDNSSIDTLTKRNAVSATRLGARTKLYITTGIVIASLLLFLVIYNFFVISKMGNSIDILQDDLAYQEYQVVDKARQVNNLTDDAVLTQQLTNMGYAEVTSEITINSTTNDYQEIKGESNWFDKFCEFIGSIFGG